MSIYTGHIKEIQESLFLIESLDSQYKVEPYIPSEQYQNEMKADDESR